MTNAEDVVRDVLRDVADEGQPVDLAGRALTGVARRRRRARLMATGLTVILITGGVAAAVRLAKPQPPVPAVPAAPSVSVSSSPGPRPSRTDGLLVFAYSVEGHHPLVLNPSTGRYREAIDLDGILAVSPDLRWAIAYWNEPPRMVNGERIAFFRLGLFDTSVGQVVRSLDLPPSVGSVAWSPDGRQVVVGLRTGINGLGWLADRLAFVDVATGGWRQVAISPAGGWEPQDLVGWTADSRGIVFAADHAGTDELPAAHIVYDLDGKVMSVRPWGKQYSYSALRPRTDHVLLVPVDPGQCAVMDPSTGSVLRRFACPTLLDDRPDGIAGWYDDTRAVVLDGAEVLLLDPSTGARQRVATLPEPAASITLAAGTAITGPAASLLF